MTLSSGGFVGPDSLRVAPEGGIPVDGPHEEMTIRFPATYRVDLKARLPGGGIYLAGPDSVPLHFHATLIMDDGRRREFVDDGYAGGGRGLPVEMNFLLVDSALAGRATAVVLSSNVRVPLAAVTWWTGDKGKRMEWP